ncbi:phosphoglycerate kinase [Paenibacillus yonginensis]|uniref:Phosphoglycerate kinase n=1 Tax=Paenibacillus yonginensis TaxID=1462996 RepID=A0A1B1MXD6_9BACL|nr:histidine phosphatase family protein [Paenibacillus yonginensis]ANS73807.1 phosphoglycerate kinase [Paenibacillus yonginensis]
MTHVGLIRHGSTLWNKAGRVQGLTDNPLDEDGRREAKLLGQWLSSQQWDRIYASDLIRARETAEIIAGELGIKDIQVDPRLREMNAGQIEGTTEEERRSKWGLEWNKLELGLEAPDQGMERGSAVITEIADKHAGERILIVSHGVLLHHSLRKLVPGLADKMNLSNTAFTLLVRDNGNWVCSLYNGTEHLGRKKTSL